MILSKNYVFDSLSAINRGGRGDRNERKVLSDEEEETVAREAEEGDKEDKKSLVEQYQSLKVSLHLQTRLTG